MSKNLSELSGRKGLKYNLFDELGKLSLETGTPSKDALAKAADDFLVGKANTYGTATFYDFMRPENQGKKAYVCNGSTCLCAGTQDAVKEQLEKHYHADEIGEMCCLGRCHENGAFHIDGKNYSAKTAKEIAQIAANGKQNGIQGNKDKYHVECHGVEVLTAPFPGVDAYYNLLLSMIERGQDACLEDIKLSNIRGRGGAGFPMWIKLDGCRKAVGDQKFIVCNADEGDPGAYTDRYLLEERPHSVLFGMMVAGYVTGADYGAVYIRAEYPEAIEITENAPRFEKLVPWDYPLQILYDSKSWCAVEKPEGISTHFSPSENSQETLANALVFHFGKNLATNTEIIEGAEIPRPGIVNRLDKPTSGIVLVAKTDSALRFFQKNWKQVEKIYIAVVSGKPPLSGKIEGGILRDTKNRQKMTISASEKARSATTLFWRESVNESKNTSVIKVQILTGRTHQIRVHFSSIGFSILGDAKYGGRQTKRFLLHAHKLRIPDPDNKEKFIEIESPLPKDFL